MSLPAAIAALGYSNAEYEWLLRLSESAARNSPMAHRRGMFMLKIDRDDITDNGELPTEYREKAGSVLPHHWTPPRANANAAESL